MWSHYLVPFISLIPGSSGKWAAGIILWHNMVWGPQTCWSPDCPQISLGSLHSFSPVLSFITSQIPWRDAWTQFSHSFTHVCSWEHSLWSSSTLLCSLPFDLCHLPGAFDPSLLSSCLPCCCLPFPSSLHNSSSFFCFPPCSFLRSLYFSYLGVIYSLEVS